MLELQDWWNRRENFETFLNFISCASLYGPMWLRQLRHDTLFHESLVPSILGHHVGFNQQIVWESGLIPYIDLHSWSWCFPYFDIVTLPRFKSSASLTPARPLGFKACTSDLFRCLCDRHAHHSRKKCWLAEGLAGQLWVRYSGRFLLPALLFFVWTLNRKFADTSLEKFMEHCNPYCNPWNIYIYIYVYIIYILVF